MASDKEISNQKKEEHNEDELRRKIREKCSACHKGDMCMIDWDQRLLCRAPEKK